MQYKRTTLALITSSTIFASMLAITPALAQENQGAQNDARPGRGRMMQQRSGVMGEVTAISGTTLTITRNGFGPRTDSQKTDAAKTFTVDASKATVIKNGQTSSLSAIVVGDHVMAEGTVNGTNVVATTIRDVMPQGNGMMNREDHKDIAVSVKGTGQPVVGGTVTSVTGSSILITNQSGVSYTIDASAATIVKRGATSTISAIASGDELIAQGTVNGSNVTATSVIDHGVKPATQTNTANGNAPANGFFGKMGGFFHRMFGFF